MPCCGAALLVPDLKADCPISREDSAESYGLKLGDVTVYWLELALLSGIIDGPDRM